LIRFSRLAVVVAAVALVAAACGSGNPTAAPSVAGPTLAPHTPAASMAAESMAAESMAAESMAPQSAAPSIVATVPDDQLTVPGHLAVCSDMPYPPQEFFDENGNAVGSDLDIARGIGARLGLAVQVNNTVFDTIIAAMQGGKCDIIVSAQNITSDRIKQVDMIPFFQAGQSFVVSKGNPAGITTQDDLCGKAIGVETGTTEDQYLNGTADYKGQGLNQACTKAGNSAIAVTEFAHDNDALLALQTGKVEAYFTDSPVAGYYTVQNPDKFELSGLELGVALEGISVPNDDAHADLRNGVQNALVAMINDGSYLAILTTYGDQAGAVTADVAGNMNQLQPASPAP